MTAPTSETGEVSGQGTQASVATSYVLLCRHGPHQNRQLIIDKESKAFPTQAVADVLQERLWFESPFADEPIRLRQVLYAPAPEVRQTTAVLARQLGRICRIGQRTELELLPPHGGNDPTPDSQPSSRRVPLCECGWLAVKQFMKPGDDRRLARWLKEVAGGNDPTIPATSAGEDEADVWAKVARPPGNAILVIGHQPHLGWLSDALLRPSGWWWRFRSFAVPFSRAELVCLAFPPRQPIGKRPPWPTPWRLHWRRRTGRVLWTITPDDRQAATAVRDKIRSKMETAKQLSAVLTFALGALLALLLDPDKWTKVTARGPLQVAAGLLLAALVLYLATMYAYDRLLMPDRFWGERRPRPAALGQRGRRWLVQRPPSSTAWVLYVNMMRVWRGLFTTATVCVVAALGLLSAAILHLDWLPLVAGVLPAGLVVALLVYWFRPVLGSED